MPIVTCPDCEANISDMARSCPHCGRPGPDHGALSVTVRDIDIGFGDLIVFIVKSAVAAIPAIIFLSVIGTLAAGLLTGSLAVLFLGK